MKCDALKQFEIKISADLKKILNSHQHPDYDPHKSSVEMFAHKTIIVRLCHENPSLRNNHLNSHQCTKLETHDR